MIAKPVLSVFFVLARHADTLHLPPHALGTHRQCPRAWSRAIRALHLRAHAPPPPAQRQCWGSSNTPHTANVKGLSVAQTQQRKRVPTSWQRNCPEESASQGLPQLLKQPAPLLVFSSVLHLHTPGALSPALGHAWHPFLYYSVAVYRSGTEAALNKCFLNK